MKKSELRQIIKEEIKKVLSEGKKVPARFYKYKDEEKLKDYFSGRDLTSAESIWDEQNSTVVVVANDGNGYWEDANGQRIPLKRNNIFCG